MDEDKPKTTKRTQKIKLTSEWSDWLPADYALVALLVAILMAIVGISSCTKHQQTTSELPLEQTDTEPKGKTWSEPGSARDTFDENFSR